LGAAAALVDVSGWAAARGEGCFEVVRLIVPELCEA